MAVQNLFRRFDPAQWPAFTLWWGLCALGLTMFIVYLVSSKLDLQGSKTSNGTDNLPPGPTPLPIIGNLHILGKLPHRTLQNLAKKYGPIMYLRLGSVPTVVASSPEMAKEFLKTHDAIFASRPLTSAGKYTSYNYMDLGFAPYGPYWRHMRKVCVLELLTAKRIESFRSMREEEVGLMVDSIREESGHGAKPVNVSGRLSSLTRNIICRMIAGRKHSDEDITGKGFLEMVQEILSVNGAFIIGDFIPSLEWLDLQGIRGRMKNVHAIFDEFAEKVIDEHVERMKSNSRQKDQHSKLDFVDVLLEMSETPQMEIRRENIKAMIYDMLVAGMDTSATTLEWAMSELLRNPHVMKRVQEELDSVVGNHRRIKEADLSSLEYLQCVVKETLRLFPVAPLMVPHESMEGCTVGGYHIPAKTRLIVNVWAIGRDPDVWEDPLAFRPERFMERDIDAVRGQNFEMIPFGSGRRGCPGASLAIVLVGFVLAQLLQCFDWSVEGDPAELNMSEVFGVTIPRQFHLFALPRPRLQDGPRSQI
eukprot:Gb_11310 [translate_table: standard]